MTERNDTLEALEFFERGETENHAASIDARVCEK